ncbi:MAG TPA: hypothetical protein PKW15_03020 [Alphaproteobacteria bacterium]|nr:hypothetical protein [Alphaproteobacteria bacterium]
MGWIARGLLLLGGIIASWFVAPDANNFHFISFVAAMLLFTGAVAIAAFGPAIFAFFRNLLRNGKS